VSDTAAEPSPLSRYKIGAAVFVAVLIGLTLISRLGGDDEAAAGPAPTDAAAASATEADGSRDGAASEQPTDSPSDGPDDAPTEGPPDPSRTSSFIGRSAPLAAEVEFPPTRYVTLPARPGGFWVGRGVFVINNGDGVEAMALEGGILEPLWSWPQSDVQQRGEDRNYVVDSARFVAGADGEVLIAAAVTLIAESGFRDPSLPPTDTAGWLLKINRAGELVDLVDTIVPDHHVADAEGNVLLHDIARNEIAIHTPDGALVGTHPLPVETPSWVGGVRGWYALGTADRQQVLWAVGSNGPRWSAGAELLDPEQTWLLHRVNDTGGAVLHSERAVLTVDRDKAAPVLSTPPAEVPNPGWRDVLAVPDTTTVVTVQTEADGDTALAGWDTTTGTAKWLYDLGGNFTPLAWEPPRGGTTLVLFGNRLMALDAVGPRELWTTTVDLEGLEDAMSVVASGSQMQINYRNAVAVFEWEPPR
jgi:hypothetical protein